MISFVRLRCKDTEVFGRKQVVYMRDGMAYMKGERVEENIAFM